MSLLSSFRTRECAWQPVRVQRLNSFPLTFTSVVFSSSTGFLASLMSKLDMLLVNASLKNSLRASVSSLSFVALPVSMSRSAIPDFAFSLLLKLKIALGSRVAYVAKVRPRVFVVLRHSHRAWFLALAYFA